MDFPAFNSLMHTLQGVTTALSSGDDFDLLQYLSQLSTELAIAQEEFLATIHLPQIISVLMQCLHKEHLPDIPFYSISCLASLVDSLPHASGIIVSSGGIPILSSKLLNFEFIDMAESSIKVLEKISIEHAPVLLNDGVFENIVQTMDFFETSVQKRILNIAVNVGKSLQPESVRKLRTLIVTFVRLLEFRGVENLVQNEKCLDFFIVTTDNLARVAGEELSGFFSQLREVQIVRNILALISQSGSLILKSIRLLRYLIRYSAEMCCEFLSMGGVDVIKDVISKLIENPGLTTETLLLVSSVLPSKSSSSQIDSRKLSIYTERPQYLRSMTEMIFPRAIAMYEEIVNLDSKAIVIEVLEKIIQLSAENDIKPFVSNPLFASFLAEVLASKDFRMVENALKIVIVLSEKMMDCVSTNFVREGVVSRVSALKEPAGFKSFKPPKDPIFDYDPLFRRCFSNDVEPSGRAIFEEILSKIRNRAMDLNEGPPQLFYQSSFESRIDYQQNLINLSKSFLDKHKNVESKSAGSYGKELIKIVKIIESSSDSAMPGFLKLVSSLSSGKRYSSHEVCNSKLPEILLKWLTDSKVSPDALLSRITEFLGVFLKQSQNGETFLEILISILIGALQYIQHFSVSVSTFPSFSSRRFNQRIRVHFLYTPDSDVLSHPDLTDKHLLFSACPQFTVSTGQYTSFDYLRNIIASAKSSRDLSSLRDPSARERRMELLGEYSGEDEYDDYSDYCHQRHEENAKISIKFFVNSQEVDLNSTIIDLFTALRVGESPQIKFKLVLKDEHKTTSESLQNPVELYSYIINESGKVSIESKSKSVPYLSLLKLLYLINDVMPVFVSGIHSACFQKLSLPVFKSSKITSLLSRQIQEQNLFLQGINPRLLQETVPVVPSLPAWVTNLPKTCRFLFPYTVREQYLHAFAVRVPLIKTKARVNRACLLEKAVLVMSDSQLMKKGQLEIDYENEVGTGIGPSLEFFSLVSIEIRNLRLWRSSDDNGLFPLPVKESCVSWKEKFNFIGRFVGKALIDKRQIDLPFSPVFWKLVLNQPVTLQDTLKVDKSLGQVLIEFSDLVKQYKAKKSKVLYRDLPIEALNLNFTLPGFEKIEIKPNGKNCLLTLDNLEEYIDLVVAKTLLQVEQAESFRKGLEAVIPSSILELFSGEEMEDLLCGQTGSPWKMEDLQQHVQPAYGYSANSAVFNNLLILMSEFNLHEQRKFLQFITGSPRLPVGGFAALNPKLTVVRKEPSLPGMHPDEYLPSVMTCQNYLKLPEYSGMEILQRNLKYAIQEGHESFHLS